jgi:hypothetical protein
MGRLSDAAGRALIPSGIVGALVFMGTIVYCADRLGWVVAIAIGWAPALLMAIIAGIGHAAVSAMIAMASCAASFAPGRAAKASASALPISGAANAS